MIITNKLRLPEPIVRAITNDTYTKGDADISVTELLGPPQIRHLRALHSHEITEDASDRMWSLLGQAVHSIIERSGYASDELSEVTLTTTFQDLKIKGTFDHLSLRNSELNDYKVTTAWKIRDGKVPPEWVAQTNIYRWILMREKNVAVNSIAIIALLRDWSKLEARRNPEYPQSQAVRLDVPLWYADRTSEFVAERIRLHQMSPPPACSDEDIWAKPDKFAVVKHNATRALRVFDNTFDASAFAAHNPGTTIEHRRGSATRCESYCAVAKFCSQWANDPRRPADPPTSLFD